MRSKNKGTVLIKVTKTSVCKLLFSRNLSVSISSMNEKIEGPWRERRIIIVMLGEQRENLSCYNI